MGCRWNWEALGQIRKHRMGRGAQNFQTTAFVRSAIPALAWLGKAMLLEFGHHLFGK
jgi:hypothetical protein